MALKFDDLHVNGIWSAILIEELWRLGVRHCCIAPGSRSAPLTFAVAEHERMNVHVHFDERGLGFFALGLAKVTNTPVAVITTSGTAVANLLPAVIEAYQSGTALVLLTADRPVEAIDCGANQTIEQPGIFGDYIGARVHLPTAERTISLRWLLTGIDQAFARSGGLPLHINCMFREPLYPHKPDIEMMNDVYLSPIHHWLTQEKPYTQYNLPTQTPLPDATAWHQFTHGKGLLVVGKIPVGSDVNTIVLLAQRLGWPLLVDVQSQLHGHDAALKHADLLLASPSGIRLLEQADRILQLGGYLTSKRLDEFIRQNNWNEYWMIDPTPRRVDTAHQQTVRLVATIDKTCQWLHQRCQSSPKLWSAWAGKVQRLAGRITVSSTEQLSEQWLGSHIGRLMPQGSGLFLGNSLPIRMVNLFSTHHLPRVYANRGVSGIDGLIATAAGCATGSRKALVLLLGDLSFFHDLNSMQLAKQSQTPLVVILINNDGGGIFYLTSKNCHANAQTIRNCFITPHGLRAEHGAALFGVRYAAPESARAFVSEFKAACAHPGCTVIEVQTPTGQGAKSIEQAIAAAEAI